MKLIIDIPDAEYRRWKEDGEIDAFIVRDAMIKGTPLDNFIEDIIENLRKDMLEYHRDLYMQGKKDASISVALCEDMIRKHFDIKGE